MARLFLFLSLALLLVGSATAQQTTACSYQGYDLSGLTGEDLFYIAPSGFSYAIRPCGVVANSSFCVDTSGGGEFCQGATTVSVMNVSAAVNPPNRPAI